MERTALVKEFGVVKKIIIEKYHKDLPINGKVTIISIDSNEIEVMNFHEGRIDGPYVKTKDGINIDSRMYSENKILLIQKK